MLVLFSHDLYGSNFDRNWRGKFLGVADFYYRGYLLVHRRLWCCTALRWDHLILVLLLTRRGTFCAAW